MWPHRTEVALDICPTQFQNINDSLKPSQRWSSRSDAFASHNGRWIACRQQRHNLYSIQDIITVLVSASAAA